MLGIFLGLGLIAIGITVYVINENSRGDYSTLYLAFNTLGAMAITISLLVAIGTPLEKKSLTSTEVDLVKMVSVNGYYIYEGNYALTNNERGQVDAKISIKVEDLKPNVNIFLQTNIKHYGFGNFHFPGTNKDTYVVLKE